MKGKSPLAGEGQDAYLLFLIYAGVGVGTVLVAQPGRQALLLVALAIVSLVYRNGHEVDVQFSLANLGRGAILGLVASVPLLAFVPETLARFSESLYNTDNALVVFYSASFAAAPVEEYFFRGIIAERCGSSPSAGLYALAGFIYFLPSAPIARAAIAALAMGILGVVYTYIHENHGLTAAVGCHLAVTFVLQVCPLLLGPLRFILS